MFRAVCAQEEEGIFVTERRHGAAGNRKRLQTLPDFVYVTMERPEARHKRPVQIDFGAGIRRSIDHLVVKRARERQRSPLLDTRFVHVRMEALQSQHFVRSWHVGGGYKEVEVAKFPLSQVF